MSDETKWQVARWRQMPEGPLGAETSARALASDANYSVSQFYRRFHKSVGQSPLKLRRRLLLERAAFELSRSCESISDIALRAQYGSFEGFSRGFKRAFGLSPSQYRALGATEYRLELPLSVHFAPPLVPEAQRQGAFAMNLLERLFGAHHLNMRLILDRCETLSEEQLDQPVDHYFDPLPWMQESQSIRSLLKHLIGNGAPWPGLTPDKIYDTDTLAGLRSALEDSYPRFMALIASHEREGLWDLTFVDAECDPPMVFSYGGWIGHMIVFQNYRRIALMQSLKAAGIDDLAYCDPVDYKGDSPESIAKWSLERPESADQ